jgi:riboflavin kinase/FMN adenylyltransferase
VEKVCQAARLRKGNSVIVSFLEHPKKVISENFNHGVLTTQSEKIDILSEIGLNNLIIMEFTSEIANMDYADFIAFLQTKIGIQKMVLGYNHRFGKNREGCYATLLKLGKDLHFEVEEIEEQTLDGQPISSSAIRHALHCGDIETANKLLGYNKMG